MIIPPGIATDQTTSHFFRDLMSTRQLSALFIFENEEKLFAGIDHRVNFSLLTLAGGERPSAAADFVGFVRRADLLKEDERHVRLSIEDIELLNPNTRTCPIFRRRRDAEINSSIYRRVPVLWREGPPESNPWGVRFTAMLHMAGDSTLFRGADALESEGWHREGNSYRRGSERYLPLYEAKMVHLYNHRFGDFGLLAPGEREHMLPQASSTMLTDPAYLLTPRHWVPEPEVRTRLQPWDRPWLMGWRDVTDARSSIRTVVPAVIPDVACGDTFLLYFPHPREPAPMLLGNLCSFVLDYAGRQKIGGVHLKYHVFKQLPILPPERYSAPAPWDPTAKDLAAWILPRVVELTYTAWDLEAFGQDCGYPGPPFRWDEARRFQLRCELDAAYFHLYGIEKDDVAYIMDSFPIVRKADEKAHGHFRTRDTILAIYDQLREAERTGVPYRCPLDPPPADPRQAHTPREVSVS